MSTEARTRLAEAGAADEHVVTFYEGEAFLVDAVTAFLLPALVAGDAAVVVATPDHGHAFDAALADAGIDLPTAAVQGRYVRLDAEETLATFLVDGAPDPDRFFAAVGGIVDAAGAGGRRVRVYGEMVAVLWARDAVPAAITVEQLWNELGVTHPFSLCCGYPLTAAEGEGSAAALRQVCRNHSAVIPGEGYTAVQDPDDRRRAVALLQQEVWSARAEELALQRRQRQLEATLDRLGAHEEDRTEFLAMVAHELRSPAAMVTGFLELLREDLLAGNASDADELLTRALANTARIERLVSDVMTLARLDATDFDLRLRPTDLGAVAGRAAAAATAATGRTVELRVDPALPPVPADAERLTQVFDNLLSNALRFSPPTGDVTVTATRRGGECVVSVRDRGDGIPAEHAEAVFEPFTRLAALRPEPDTGTGTRTGLGLSIARRLVEGQGGRIWVEPVDGPGADVRFTLPLPPAAARTA